MKRKKFWKDVSRFVTPAALIVLGLVLLFCPDTASALISRVAGWVLTSAALWWPLPWWWTDGCLWDSCYPLWCWCSWDGI